jgi:hypothetical protein
MLAELIQAGSETLQSEIHDINSIWSKEELPISESITVPVHKKGEKIDCTDYCGISIYYKMLSNILLSRLNPYIDEIIGVH